jgi:enediyne biosynthesis protein E4
MKRYARILLALVFAGLLMTPFLVRRFGRSARASAPPAASSALAQYGFRLTESAKAAGLAFVHEAPTLDPKLAHIMPQVASMGAAVSVVDVDADGLYDLYVTTSKEGSRNRLFRNRGNGTFEDVAERLGIAELNQPDTGVSMGSVWGDYDNDGFEDLFLYRWGRSELFHNDQGQRFTRVTDAVGLPSWANINAAVWLDFDRDGDLDLFMGGYYPERVNLWKLADTKMMPESFEYANNGGRKYLFENTGGGRFAEVSERVGLVSNRWALGAVAADIRGTGYPDIFIANDYGVSELFVNDRGRFREVGREAGVGYAPKSGMNASVGDILNQGRFAIYVSNISEEGILLQGNNLWVPTGSVQGVPRFENLARPMGVDLGGWSFGAQFGDLNNDGFLDIYLVNGYVSASREESYWYDFSKVAGGHEIVISDARNWPAMGDRSLAGYQQKKVWISDGAGRFIDVAQMVGATDRYDGRSVALADLSNRGALDVIVANQRGPLLMYRNEVAPDRQWIAFDLAGACRPDSSRSDRTRAACTNRSAIGAQVTLFWKGQQQLQEVLGGSGFCAQNQRRLHFGLGRGATVDKAIVRWPSGKVQELVRPEPNRVHKLEEPA